MLALDLGVALQQQQRQPHHALLVEPGGVLCLGAAEQLQLGFGILRGIEFLQVLRQPILVLDEEGLAQNLQPLLQIRLFKGFHHLGSRLLRCLELFRPQRGRACMPALRRRLAVQRCRRRSKVLQFQHQLLKRQHRSFQHPVLVRQTEFNTLGQCGFQRLQRVAAAMQAYQRIEIGARRIIAQQRLEKRPPDFGHGARIILQQFVLAGQALLFQHLQRCRAQQGGKPAVEGADLRAATVLQQLQVQPLQRRRMLLRLLRRHAAHPQLRLQLLRRLAGKIGQPFVQALAHFGSGLLGKGDRQDLLRLGSFQQGTQDAADQHPGLAGTGTGLDHHMACRVAGHGVKSLVRHDLAVDPIGVGAAHACSSIQKSRRHRPRIAQ